MSRGRKAASYKTFSNWEDIFWNCLPIYIGIIINHFKKSGFEMINVSDNLQKLSFAIPKGLTSKEINKNGTYPVISQSKEYIIGFSEREDLLVKNDLPMIIFGDHSKTIKYVDAPFIIGADGVKLIKPKNIFNERFFYYFLYGIITDTKDYGRHFALLRKGQLPKIDRIELQKSIVNFLDDLKLNSVLTENTYFNKEIEDEIVLLQENQFKGNYLALEITNQLDLVKQLRQSFLREAMQGKLVKQNPNDEPARELLKKIKAEKEKLVNEKILKKEKILIPIKEEEIPFDIPENWVWCRLGDICQIKGGKRVPNGYQLLKISTPHIYIRVSDMKNGSISDNDLHYIDEEVFQKIKQYTISKDDIYMTIVGGTIGKCGIVPDKFHNMNLTENAAKIIPHEVDKLFLLQCLNSPFCQKQFIDKTKQVGVQKMALNRFSSSFIPLPPLAEQKRIVEKLDQLMKYCDELETSIKESKTFNDQLRQQVLKEALNKEKYQ